MHIIVYDFGSTSLKTCLFDLDSEIRLVASAAAGYSLFVSDDGGVEQDTEPARQLCRFNQRQGHDLEVQVGGEQRTRRLQENLQMAGHLRLSRLTLHGQVCEDR